MRALATLLLLAALGTACSTPERAPALPRAPGAAGGGRARELKVTILSTMLADRGIGEWGFAALLEVDGRGILFDTGYLPDTVLRNAKTLGVDLSTIEEVVLSHHHSDHTGGLAAIRSAVIATNPKAISRVHVGKGMFLSRPAKGRERNAVLALREGFEAGGGTFVEHAAPVELYPGVWLTGPVPRVHAEKNWSGAGALKDQSGLLVEDDLPEDMSVVVDTDRGLVVLSGCGHAGIVNTLEHARARIRDTKVHAAIGGFHLFEQEASVLEWTALKLRAHGVEHFIGAHCTGLEATYVLRAQVGLERKTCVVGAVGSSYTLGKGIDPRSLAK